MFTLNEIGLLTVYNGTEEKYCESGNGKERFLPERCCNIRIDDPEKKVDEGCGALAECSDDLKLLHRQLILGEPFTIEKKDGSGSCLSWTPITDEWALEMAIKVIEKVENLNKLIRANLPYAEDNLFVAISLVRTFIQLNYTGPDLPSSEVKEKLETLEKICDEKFKIQLHQFEELDGIEVDSRVRLPVLLLVAHYFLSSLQSHPVAWPFYLIWRFRIDYLHQRMLSRRSWSLSRRLKHCGEEYINWMATHEMSGVLVDVHVSFLCEIAEMLVYYYDGILSERVLAHVIKVLGLAVEFSGKMGYRTKFQQTPTPQMVMTVKPNTKAGIRQEDQAMNRNCVYPDTETLIPKSEALNDDTRLDRLRLVEEDSKQTYDNVHQLVLLGNLLHKQGFHGNTELKRQEAEALINAILDRPVNWSGRISALIARCQIEKHDRRAVDRSLRQLQELSKTTSSRLTATDDVFRQYLFFGSGHPLKSELKMLYGETLLSLEHWKEGLQIYTELGAFEEIVRCYEMMNLRHKAEELVREKIVDAGKTPKVLVLLGDVTSDISFYEEAWTLSSGTSLNSQIRLGNHYFRREEFALAIRHLKRVVKLAPLEYPSWIKLAWACYRTEDYETAFQAYLRAANLEYDNFQVWNNLANCARKINRKDYALRAYKVAAKCHYDEWRVWSNILIVASELDSITDSIQAYHRILDLNKSFSDSTVLDKIVDFVVNSSEPNFLTISAVAKLFGRISSTVAARSPMIWLLYGRLLTSYLDCPAKDCDDETKSNNFERAMHYYDKALTLMRQNPSWKSDVATLQNVVSCIQEYREIRERGRSMLSSDSNNRLKGSDNMLRQTTSAVFATLKKLIEDLPTQNEKLELIFNNITEEIKNPFYDESSSTASST